jgi:ABC-2 type transport system permease protein
MLTPAKLFLKRLNAHRKFQWSVLRLVVDWIIALYFIVPVLVILGFNYHSWWVKAPVWITHVPYTLVVIVLYRVATMGTVRLFVEEADQLFLLQHPKWIQRLKQLGMTYSLFFHLVISVGVTALLAPLLYNQYLLSLSQIVLLFLYIFVLRNLSAFLKVFITLRFVGWRYWLCTIGLQLVMSVVFGFTLLSKKAEPLIWSGEIVLFAILSYFLMKIRLYLKGTFSRDVEHENTQRMKFIALLLKGRVKFDKKRKKRRMKPFFFTHSNLIFKKRIPSNGLIEVYLKSFIRNGVQLRLYIQFLAVGMAFLALPFIPKTIKIILWLVLAIFFCNWLKTYFYEVLDSPFVQMFSWKESDRQISAQKGIFFVMLPGYSLLSLTIGLTSLTFIGTLQLLLFGGVVAYLMTSVVVMFTFRKQ